MRIADLMLLQVLGLQLLQLKFSHMAPSISYIANDSRTLTPHTKAASQEKPSVFPANQPQISPAQRTRRSGQSCVLQAIPAVTPPSHSVWKYEARGVAMVT